MKGRERGGKIRNNKNFREEWDDYKCNVHMQTITHSYTYIYVDRKTLFLSDLSFHQMKTFGSTRKPSAFQLRCEAFVSKYANKT